MTETYEHMNEYKIWKALNWHKQFETLIFPENLIGIHRKVRRILRAGLEYCPSISGQLPRLGHKKTKLDPNISNLILTQAMYSGSKMEANHGTKIEARSAPKLEAQSWRLNLFSANLVKSMKLEPQKHKIQKALSWHKLAETLVSCCAVAGGVWNWFDPWQGS